MQRLACLAAVLFMGFMMVRDLYQAWNLAAHGVQAQATIVAEANMGTRGAYRYMVEYDGHRHEHSFGYSMAVGRQMAVTYMPGNPALMRIYHDNWMVGTIRHHGVVIYGLGAAVIVFCLFQMLAGRRKGG